MRQKVKFYFPGTVIKFRAKNVKIMRDDNGKLVEVNWEGANKIVAIRNFDDLLAVEVIP